MYCFSILRCTYAHGNLLCKQFWILKTLVLSTVNYAQCYIYDWKCMQPLSHFIILTYFSLFTEKPPQNSSSFHSHNTASILLSKTRRASETRLSQYLFT